MTNNCHITKHVNTQTEQTQMQTNPCHARESNPGPVLPQYDALQ